MADDPKSKRDDKGRWLPGVSGRPGGRPGGLHALIDKLSVDGKGEESVRRLFELMRGTVNVTLPGGAVETVLVPVQVMRKAAADISAWRYGKPVQQVEVSGVDELAELSEEQLDGLLVEQLLANPKLREQVLAELGLTLPHHPTEQ